MTNKIKRKSEPDVTEAIKLMKVNSNNLEKKEEK